MGLRWLSKVCARCFKGTSDKQENQEEEMLKSKKGLGLAELLEAEVAGAVTQPIPGHSDKQVEQAPPGKVADRVVEMPSVTKEQHTRCAFPSGIMSVAAKVERLDLDEKPLPALAKGKNTNKSASVKETTGNACKRPTGKGNKSGGVEPLEGAGAGAVTHPITGHGPVEQAWSPPGAGKVVDDRVVLSVTKEQHTPSGMINAELSELVEKPKLLPAVAKDGASTTTSLCPIRKTNKTSRVAGGDTEEVVKMETKKVHFTEDTKDGTKAAMEPLPLDLQVRVAQLELDLEMELIRDLHIISANSVKKNGPGRLAWPRELQELGPRIEEELLERRGKLLGWKKMLLNHLDPEGFPEKNDGARAGRRHLHPRRCALADLDLDLEIGVAKMETWLELRALHHICRYQKEFKTQKRGGDTTLESARLVYRVLEASYYTHKCAYRNKAHTVAALERELRLQCHGSTI